MMMIMVAMVMMMMIVVGFRFTVHHVASKQT
jgi:hypothetical protein